MRLSPALALPLAVAAALAACADAPASGPQGDAEAVALVRAAQEAHGSDALDGVPFRFTFRGDAFTAERSARGFRYVRTTTDDQGRTVVDVLDNDGLSRTIDGETAPLPEDEVGRLTTAVNSVVYFATLPAPLSDPAVQARVLPLDTLDGTTYDRLEITFAQEGGGNDWEDRYLYWIHPERRTLDFIAYTYALAPDASGENDTGHRFRRVIGTADAGGFRVQDYENLTADSLGTLEDYASAYASGRTRAVSEVLTENARLGD
ncbi:MAG: DUF6503 family protein [Bacteroidota bacterium]